MQYIRFLNWIQALGCFEFNCPWKRYHYMRLIGQCDSVFELNWGTLYTVPKLLYLSFTQKLNIREKNSAWIFSCLNFKSWWVLSPVWFTKVKQTRKVAIFWYPCKYEKKKKPCSARITTPHGHTPKKRTKKKQYLFCWST